MKQLRSLIVTATIGLALAANASTARADGPPGGPAPGYPGGPGMGYPGGTGPGYPGYPGPGYPGPGKPGYPKSPDGHGMPVTLSQAYLENCGAPGTRLAQFCLNHRKPNLPVFQAAVVQLLAIRRALPHPRPGQRVSSTARL